MLVDKSKKSQKVKISKIPIVMFLALLMAITGFPIEDYYNAENNVAQAAPSYNNPDGGTGSSVNYIRPSDFTGSGYNKSRGIFPGSRDEGYTCWHNGDVNSSITGHSYNLFFGNTNRSGGRGNEGFVETHGLLGQCGNDAKLLEYEVYAGDAFSNRALEPIITSDEELRMYGWSTLGGYSHHTRNSESTYAVAVEQVNGRNTNNSNGVHIEKAHTRGVDMTSALSYGGLDECLPWEYNRFRGTYNWSSDNVRVQYGSWPYRGTVTSNINNRAGNVYDVYGGGCNFNYPASGFALTADMQDLFSDLTEEKEYKMYIVKRVNDMIVSTEMAIPNDTSTFDYGYGEIELDGNATPGDDTVTVNRTGIPLCEDFVWGTGCVDRDGSGYFNYGESVELIDIQSIEGNASIYTVQRSNGNVYKHLSNYFGYSNDNEGAVLRYTPETVNVDVNHYDIVSCGTGIAGERWDNIRTQNLDCDNLREISSGNIAKQGTGEYAQRTQERFHTYDDGELYLNNRSENYRLHDSNSVMSNRYTTFTTGIRDARLNFFYVNQNDLHTFRVNYRDTEGSYLYGRDANSNDQIRGYIQFNNVLSNRTVNYNNPQTVIGSDGRLYERLSGSHSGTSSTVTSSQTINVEYQRQPTLTIRYINDDTGQVIRQTTEHMEYGSDVSGNHPISFMLGGTEYHKFEADTAYSVPNITEDTTLDVYYKDTPPLPYPTDVFEFDENAVEPSTNISDFSWRLDEDTLDTNLGLTFDSTHADAEDATIIEYVGENDYNSESNTYNNDNGLRQVNTTPVNLTDGTDYGSAYSFDKDTLDKYQVNVEYDFTNVIEMNYICDDGVEDRCFDWIIDPDNPSDPYWGDGEHGNTVNVDGSDVDARQTYEANLELIIENDLGEEFDIEDIPENMVIGKSLDDSTSLTGTGTNVINEETSSITTQNEAINVSPFEVDDLDTQSSITVEEEIGYENSFEEELPEPKDVSRYFIGNIDENLEESMETEEVDEEEYSVSELRLDDNEFKLDTVFGLSNKYGVQFGADFEDVSDDDIVLDEELSNQLEELDLGADEVQDLDYSNSRYFLPIDDVEYNSDYVFQDLVELNSLGLNEITVNYDKEFSFEDFLYGNVMDEPIYSEQKDSVQSTEYPNTENFTQSELEGMENEPERQGKFNLFRVTDDEQIDGFLD